MKTFAAKGPKEIQSDLPFDQIMPPFKDNILPLEENGNTQTESVQTEEQTQTLIQENEISETQIGEENKEEKSESDGGIQ